MGQKLEQIASVVTPVDAAHGGAGLLVVLNSVWMDWINPGVQVGLTLGGAIYLYYTIRHMRAAWLLKKRDLDK